MPLQQSPDMLTAVPALLGDDQSSKNNFEVELVGAFNGFISGCAQGMDEAAFLDYFLPHIPTLNEIEGAEGYFYSVSSGGEAHLGHIYQGWGKTGELLYTYYRD